MPLATDIQHASNDFIIQFQQKADTAIANLTASASFSGGTCLPYSGSEPSLGGNVLADYAALPSLVAYDFSGLTPPDISTLVPDISQYNRPVWSDTYWTNLKNEVSAFVGNITGSDDVSSLVTKLASETQRLQVDLFQQDMQRKQQILRDLYSAANAETGASGFSFPNMLTVALKMDAQQKYQMDLNQGSRDIIKYVMEWAKENWKFTVEKGISVQEKEISFNLGYAEAILKSYATQLNGIIDEFKTQVMYAIEKANVAIKEYNENLEKIKAKGSSASDYDRSQVALYGQKVTNTIESNKATLASQTDAYKNKTSAHATATQAIAGIASSAAQIAIGIGNE